MGRGVVEGSGLEFGRGIGIRDSAPERLQGCRLH
jgi:hypothetical protein